MNTAKRRETKYTRAIKAWMATLGHATNAELAVVLRDDFPDVSDTTIHRVTQRLLLDGQLGLAPQAADGSARYDANVNAHDHFMCDDCGRLRDITVPQSVRQQLQSEVNDCHLSGNLVIVGDCNKCKER